MTEKKIISLEEIRRRSIKDQLPEALGIDFTHVSDSSLTGVMTVDERHLRPGRIMNGGISLVLIETIGSMSSYLKINPENQNAFGIQVSANHISIARPGDRLTARSQAIHIGRSTHIWDVVITNQLEKTISSGRITMLVTDI